MQDLMIYAGANVGNGLFAYVNRFKRILAFEPDPEIFSILQKNMSPYQNVELINGCLTNETGVKTLHIHPNKVSTSLSDLNPVYLGNAEQMYRTISVLSYNLNEILIMNNIHYIDFYLSDCQGSDLTILKTILPFIDNKQINELYVETHRDGVEIYNGMNNQLSEFKKILDVNYEMISQLPENELEIEFDVHWRLKQI